MRGNNTTITVLVAIIVVLAGGLALTWYLYNPEFAAVAEVGDDKITVADYQDYMTEYYGAYALTQLIRSKVIYDEAARLGVGVTGEEIDAELETIKSAYGVASDQELENIILNSYGIPLADFKEQLRLAYTLNKIRLHGVEVSDDEAMQYYAENENEYVELESADVRHILTSTIDQAIAARERIIAGEDFDTVAMEVSEDTGKETHGTDFTDVRRDGSYDEDFVEGALMLEEGELSEPVETQFGYHIILCEAKRPARQLEFSEVKEGITDELKEQVAPNRTEVLSRLMQEANIKIRLDDIREDVEFELGIE